MCDPISVGIGLVGGMVASKALAPKSAPAAAALPTTTPAEDAAKAEAEAAQKANAQLASDNRRRREQQSLMATGAPSPSPAAFGDTATADGISPLGGIARNMSRGVVAKRTASLMSGGAPASAMPGGAPRSGGGSYKLQMEP